MLRLNKVAQKANGGGYYNLKYNIPKQEVN